MSFDPRAELVAQLNALIEQAAHGAEPVLARITAVIAANGYLEALTRDLVNEARDEGRTWEEVAEVFRTSAQNVRARFGSTRDYDDE